MEFDIRQPNINPAASERTQIEQMKSYLIQLAQQLQWAFASLDTSSHTVIVNPISTPSDFVVEQGAVEQGVDGIWHLRKWNSGIAECWGSRRVTVTNFEGWETIYSSLVNSYAYPTGLFKDVPMCQVSAEVVETGQPAWIAAIAGQSTEEQTPKQTPKLLICKPTNESAGYDILYYAIGRWK